MLRIAGMHGADISTQVTAESSGHRVQTTATLPPGMWQGKLAVEPQHTNSLAASLAASRLWHKGYSPWGLAVLLVRKAVAPVHVVLAAVARGHCCDRVLKFTLAASYCPSVHDKALQFN